MIILIQYRNMIQEMIKFAVSPSGKPPRTGFLPTCALG